VTTLNTDLAVVDEPKGLDEIADTIVHHRQTVPAVRGHGEMLQPQNFQELCAIANVLAKSDAVPKSYQGKPTAIVVAGMAGAELGLPLLKALQGICVINGVPSLYGKTAFAMVTRHQDFDGIEEWEEGDPFDDAQPYVYHVTLKRRGRNDVHRSFSKAEAKAIKVQSGQNGKVALWDKPGPWLDGYKRRMCRWRAFGFGAADQFADALLGFGIVEEMIDVTPGNPRIAVSAAPSRTAAIRETITQQRPAETAIESADIIVPPSREAAAPEGSDAPAEATASSEAAQSQAQISEAATETTSARSFDIPDEGGDEEPRRINSDTAMRLKGAVDFTTAKTICNFAADAGMTENELEKLIFEKTGQYVLKKGATVTEIMNAVRGRRTA
jgi:hypothetical protein